MCLLVFFGGKIFGKTDFWPEAVPPFFRLIIQGLWCMFSLKLLIRYSFQHHFPDQFWTIYVGLHVTSWKLQIVPFSYLSIYLFIYFSNFLFPWWLDEPGLLVHNNMTAKLSKVTSLLYLFHPWKDFLLQQRGISWNMLLPNSGLKKKIIFGE